MQQSLGYALRFVLVFYLILIWLPAKVMRYRILDEKEGFENCIKAVIISHLVLINGVFLLSFFHIYKPVFLILYVCVMVLIGMKLNGAKFLQILNTGLDWLYHLSKRQYKLRPFVSRWGGELMMHTKYYIRTLLKQFFNRNILYNLILLASFAVLIYRRFLLVFDNYAYLTSDMYVHGDWINYLEQDTIFYDGVYPFGMHNMISSFHMLSGLTLNVVNRYWGPFTSILLLMVLYWYLKRTFHNPKLAILPIVIYCISDFVNNDYCYRLDFTLTQETGMMFILPCAYFFGKYLKERKKLDAVFFVLSAGLILSIHFYTVIFAVLLCFGVCFAFLKELLNWKMIRKMLFYVLLIGVIGLAPLIVGLMQGRYWQGSTTWALSLVQGNLDSFLAENASNEEQKQQAQQNLEQQEEQQEETKKTPLLVRFSNGMKETVKQQINDMPAFWGWLFWGSMLWCVLYSIIRFFIRKKADWIDRMQLCLWWFLVFCVVLYASWAFELPTLIQNQRIRMFLGYLVPVMLIIPFDNLLLFFKKARVRVSYVLCYVMSALLFFRGVQQGIPYQSYFYLEPSLAGRACVSIQEEFEDNTWTIVSPVDEITMIRGHGFHYELWQFISEMEPYDKTMRCIIPTKYVFFFLEKRPLQYNQYRATGYYYENPTFRVADAQKIVTKEMLHISDEGVMKYYMNYDNRKALEAKLYYWLEAYKEAFPDQFEVYMEDDECIIYKFTQNELAMNNFAIPYMYNEITEERYNYELKRSNEEYALTHPEVTTQE